MGPQIPQQPPGMIDVLRGGGLGQLQLETGRRQAIPAERAQHHLRQLRIAALGGREIHRHLDAGEPLGAPSGGLPAGGVQGPEPDFGHGG